MIVLVLDCWLTDFAEFIIIIIMVPTVQYSQTRVVVLVNKSQKWTLPMQDN